MIGQRPSTLIVKLLILERSKIMAVTLRKSSDGVSLVKRSDSLPLPSGCTFNTPCPAAGKITTIAGRPVAKIDYSDGYGGTYAPGE